MDDAKKFQILAEITRASHFEWRRAALAMAPDVEPLELVKRYWTEVGKDTARFYLKDIDPAGDLPAQVARLIVSSSVAMGEDAEVLGPSSDGVWEVRHNACPWYRWHKQEDLLHEDRPGCDCWFATLVEEINGALGTALRFETLETLPDGGPSCLRRLWVEE